MSIFPIKDDVVNAVLDINLATGIFSCRMHRDRRLATLMVNHIIAVVNLLRSEASSGLVSAETASKVEECFGILNVANKDFLANARTFGSPFDVDAFHSLWQTADYNNAITLATHAILLPVGLPPPPSGLRAQCEWSKQILEVSQQAKDEKIAREAAEQEAAEYEAQRAAEVAVAAAAAAVAAEVAASDSNFHDNLYYDGYFDDYSPMVNVNGTPMAPGWDFDIT